jgi:hypothetical protein
MIVFLAFGTRGDVQPLACLSAYLQREAGQRIAFITHTDHQTWIEGAPFNPSLDVTFIYIDSPPSGPAAQTRAEEEHTQHVACWDAIRGLQQEVSLIAFNLFALEARGYIIYSSNLKFSYLIHSGRYGSCTQPCCFVCQQQQRSPSSAYPPLTPSTRPLRGFTSLRPWTCHAWLPRHVKCLTRARVDSRGGLFQSTAYDCTECLAKPERTSAISPRRVPTLKRGLPPRAAS